MLTARLRMFGAVTKNQETAPFSLHIVRYNMSKGTVLWSSLRVCTLRFHNRVILPAIIIVQYPCTTPTSDNQHHVNLHRSGVLLDAVPPHNRVSPTFAGPSTPFAGKTSCATSVSWALVNLTTFQHLPQAPY